MTQASSKNRPRLALLLLLGLFCFALLVQLGLGVIDRPARVGGIQKFQVETGMSALEIGMLLEERELVRSARFFEWAVRWNGLSHQLKAGKYEIDSARSTTEIVNTLLEAPLELVRVTIPEGLTRTEIAAVLEQQIGLDSTRFVELTENTRLIRQLGIDAPTLEGYLFPETYFLDSKTTEEDVVRRMVGQFHDVFNDSLQIELGDLGLTLHDAVTLASIVEREAVVAEERPIIAAVFHRRLRLDRLLESCATVEFALGVHKKRLTNEDLRVKSDYNTYLHRGLPPGPIGNPGASSLRATVFPSDTNFLYFVARGDGRHVFSRTHSEHREAKRVIRLHERRNRQRAN